jgi:hypothetical protein
MSEGEKMERQMWADFKAKDWKSVERKIAEGFQSIHPDGARDPAGEIKLIENLNLGEARLTETSTEGVAFPLERFGRTAVLFEVAPVQRWSPRSLRSNSPQGNEETREGKLPPFTCLLDKGFR